jgi:hypothetical protein
MNADANPSPALRQRYEQLKQQLLALGWVCQGSVVEVARPQGEARPYYRWTRKEDQKTVTVALSASQVKVFRRAMKQHRKLQTIIRQMRQLSAQVLLETTAGVPRRKRKKSS